MRTETLIAAVISVCICGIVSAQSPDVIIPTPAEFRFTGGTCNFTGEPQVKILHNAKDIRPEGYRMTISRKGVKVEAADEAGAFYAMQSLDQMTAGGSISELACCEINDYPRFPYRGLHFDVSRHFRSIDFLKKQIDAMAHFKMNKMHIHLTDAAGWRMQIDAFPRLTGFAAWRPEKKWKDWWFGDRLYSEAGTPGAYGGFYTKDELMDLVEYAAARHIDIIPEIEMPGHSEEVLAAYPELSCSGEPYSGSDFCIGKDRTVEFLEKVLDEVMEVFPYEYIHIGGDEASKKNWKECPDCQHRMAEEGLKDVDELQSWLIKRIERYVISKGRKIIGWDEILEGGVSPTATVMSWRGTEGGIRAMGYGNDIIMTPGKYCYLDHAQDAPFREPESIGGYLPLELAYSYEPVEESMPADGLHHLKGVQANLWSEYITEDSHAEYMYWPRAAAIAETGWSPQGSKDYAGFRERMVRETELLKARGYNPFDISREYGERKASAKLVEHKAIGASVTYHKPYSNAYTGEGDGTLTDGKAGGWAYGDGRWLGFISDIDLTVDLGSTMPVHYIGATFMQVIGPEVFMPERVEIYTSEDGVEFGLAGICHNDVPVTAEELLFREFGTVCNTNARYIRYKAFRNPVCRGWLFTDEIVVN